MDSSSVLLLVSSLWSPSCPGYSLNTTSPPQNRLNSVKTQQKRTMKKMKKTNLTDLLWYHSYLHSLCFPSTSSCTILNDSVVSSCPASISKPSGSLMKGEIGGNENSVISSSSEPSSFSLKIAIWLVDPILAYLPAVTSKASVVRPDLSRESISSSVSSLMVKS